ncbi:hypothetical protein ILUMI_20824 [Ignelater luminosus]|uniref:DDE-1 domain-containing protein n=1 Tax=Ignelater luminosus TaxID=2038154 RepID=A0A8K0CK39_IGNLU|nr:hypothetical protein ILUMI_20824 [Ignelater luminosus]
MMSQTYGQKMDHKEQGTTASDMDGWSNIKRIVRVSSFTNIKAATRKKVVIRDNLASHISFNVLRLCEENNVKFVHMSTPNLTYIMQPLNIVCFRPLKIKWKQVLWKLSARAKKQTALLKDQFPALFKKTLDELHPVTSQNVISDFRKVGIVPINVEELLNRLPHQDRKVYLDMIVDGFLQRLEDKRSEMVIPKTNGRKKMNVAASQQRQVREKGRSKRPASSELSSEEDDNYSIASSLENNKSFGSLQNEERDNIMPGIPPVKDISPERSPKEDISPNNLGYALYHLKVHHWEIEAVFEETVLNQAITSLSYGKESNILVLSFPLEMIEPVIECVEEEKKG